MAPAGALSTSPREEREVELNPQGRASLLSSWQTDLFLSACDLLSRPVAWPTSTANYHKSPAAFVLPFSLCSQRRVCVAIDSRGLLTSPSPDGETEAHNRYVAPK